MASRIVEDWVKNGLCCFCSEPVGASDIDSCRLSIATANDECQLWPCHARCFRERWADLPYADAITGGGD